MAPKRSILGPGLLTIDPSNPTKKEFAGQVTNCELIPKVSQSDPIPVLSGDSVPGERTESWSLKAKLLPDFGQADSIQEWLFTNRGKTMDFEFIPNSAMNKKLTGKLTIEATNIGGDALKSDVVEAEFQVLDPKLTAHTPTP